MKKEHLLTAALLLALLSVPVMALASDISDAKWYGQITITNNSTALTSVVTTASINTTNLQAGGYLNAGANNTTIRTSSGADVLFMPGYTPDGNPWAIWVASIGANTVLTNILYTANTSGGGIRYFPGDDGMTVEDDATLEPADNFTLSIAGWFDTDAGADKFIGDKNGAITISVNTTNSGVIDGSIAVYEDFTDNYTEVDPNGKLTVIAGKITAVNIDRDEDGYVYRDKGANHFDSLDVDFEVYVDSNSLADGLGGMALSNLVGTINDFGATEVGIYTAEVGANALIALYRGKLTATDSFLTGSLDTPYYITVTRLAGGDTVTAAIYSDSSRVTLVDTLSVSGYGATKWRYVYGFINYNNGSAGQDWDGYFKDLSYDARIVSASGVTSGEHTVQVYTGLSSSAVEDFTTYTEVDVPGNLTVIADTITAVNVDRDESIYVYKDYGHNYFDDLNWEFEIYVNSASLVNSLGATFLANSVGSMDTYGTTEVGLYTTDAGTADLILCRGKLVAGDVFNGVLNTPYYVTITRPAGGDVVTAYIYTDAARTALVDTLTVAGFGATKWRYAYGFTSYNIPLAAADWDGYVKDMKLEAESLHISVDGVLEDSIALAGATVLDNSANWTISQSAAMAYVSTANITIGGSLQGSWVWEYSDNFTDLSGNVNWGFPSFPTTGSDPDISANLTAFLPIAEATAPDYVLGLAPDFIDSDSLTGNVTGNFTTGIDSATAAGGFPLAGVIAAVADSTGTPAQLPLLLIAMFIIIASSLTASYIFRTYGVGSIVLKIVTIVVFMGIFIALKNFGVDFWMMVVFLIISVAMAMASRHAVWQ